MYHPMTYKHALELYSKYNSKEISDDWVDLNLQQNFNGRLQIVDKSILLNRLFSRCLKYHRIPKFDNNINLS